MKPKFLVGGAVIAAALAYMIYAGVTQSAVYFVTPSELQAAPVTGKAYRVGGMVLTGALLLLVYAFLTFDFSVRYVAHNTNLGTPFYYRITAVWGALEGSIVLWAWMVSLFTLLVIVRHRENARDLYPWA